jgi:hypothetical protein
MSVYLWARVLLLLTYYVRCLLNLQVNNYNSVLQVITVGLKICSSLLLTSRLVENVPCIYIYLHIVTCTMRDYSFCRA